MKEILEERFDGRPITEQNLSEWKQGGGFKDWQRHQETRALARDFLAEAEEVEEEIGDTPLTDRLSETVALLLAQLLREAASGEKGPAQMRAAIEITRELARWRRQDHQMKRLRREGPPPPRRGTAQSTSQIRVNPTKSNQKNDSHRVESDLQPGASMAARARSSIRSPLCTTAAGAICAGRSRLGFLGNRTKVQYPAKNG